MTTEPLQVFVYGTLMPGLPLWPMLARFAHSWTDAVTSGELWDTGVGYPAATFSDIGSEIPGVVVRLRADLSAKAVRCLDEIEGEGRLYRRVTIDTSEGSAISYEWLGNTAGLTPLPRGWRR